MDRSFVNIFSQPGVCLLSPLTMSFAEQTTLVLIESSVSYFFHGLCLDVMSEKSSSYPRSSRFSPVLYILGVLVLHFTFWSMIYFELIFMWGLGSVFRFIFLHVYVQWSQHYLLKRRFLLRSFVDDQLTVFMGFRFWAFYSFPSIYLSLLSPGPHYLDSCSFIVVLEVG